MQDLRVRFGVILAISLLPLLVFALVQSLFGFGSDKKDLRIILQNAALSAGSEIVTRIDKNQSILSAFGETFDLSSGCNSQLKRGVDAIPQLTSLEVFDTSGESICRTRSAMDSDFTMSNAEALTPETPFRTKTVSSIPTEGMINATFISTYGIFENDFLMRIIIGRFEVSNLKTLKVNPLLADDAQLELINRDGEILIGNPDQDAFMRLGWIKTVNANGHYKGQMTRPSGEIRDIIVVETDSDGLYIAVSTPETSLLSWSVINPFSSLIVPILAWLFGFLAIWFATDRLILIHLRRIQSATIGFAEGDMNARIGTLNNPPQSIFTLGRNFDFMADQIEERESTIRDSLDEKETLLREIHHRVKNNLQIIISLLNMQERKLEDQSAKNAIVETRSRINAIALVHRGLYESQDLRFVNMQIFLERLMAELSVAFGLTEKNIVTEVNAECKPMEADTATPVALFIVEALTNAVKHGVHSGGRVAILITQNGADVSVLVFDSGTGVMASSPSKAGTGSKLIKGFARQLGGNITVPDEKSGYSVKLDFTIRNT